MNIATMFASVAPAAPNGAFLPEQQCAVPVASGLPVVVRSFLPALPR